MKKIYLLTFVIFILFDSCSVVKEVEPKINYAPVSVPEEGGIRFVKYTKDSESISGPSVRALGNNWLSWYAPSFIAVSKDGKYLAYVARQNGYRNLYMRKIEGGAAIIQRTFNKFVLDMSFSPDGQQIVFTEQINGNSNVALINALKGVAIQQIANSTSDEAGATFSVDNQDVFFSKKEGQRQYIWKFNVKTSLLTQYSEGFTPVMTPDGEHIIFTRNEKASHRGEIWMMDLNTGTETMILSDPVKGYSSPSISPDGKRILVVGSTQSTKGRPQNLDIYLVNIDGTQLKQITFHGGNDVSPEWSPDGKGFFFISERGTETGVYNIWKTDLME